MLKILASRSLLAGAVLLAAGCSSGMVDNGAVTQLRSVSPRGGAVDVSTAPDFVFTFDQPVATGMEQYIALHRGGLTGTTQPMNCTWAEGQTRLVCRTSTPLDSVSAYTLHLGGGMMDATGRRVGMGRYGMEMGGNWATGGMMGGQQGMMGSGWQDTNDSYGMAFGFTTR